MKNDCHLMEYVKFYTYYNQKMFSKERAMHTDTCARSYYASLLNPSFISNATFDYVSCVVFILLLLIIAHTICPFIHIMLIASLFFAFVLSSSAFFFAVYPCQSWIVCHFDVVVVALESFLVLCASASPCLSHADNCSSVLSFNNNI